MSSAKNSQALRKYLAKYSEEETSLFYNTDLLSCLTANGKRYAHSLVIPLYDEPFSEVERLLNRCFACSDNEPNRCKPVLYILVVNCPEGGEESATDRTLELFQHLNDLIEPLNSVENILYGKHNNGNGIVIVDRCSAERRIPIKQGVGLARKIGADIACLLVSKGVINSPWIHSTDADVVLPEDYFNGAHRLSSGSDKPIALVYPFRHSPEEGYEEACELYDWSLRYYVESLEWAGSRYAYHTIGSLIAVHFEAYAQVRGFPKRSAGEDFYLLNKLAKVGVVESLKAPVVTVSARPSHRVPFGTGPALNKIAQSPDPVAEYLFYHPEIFTQLKTAIAVIKKSWQVRDMQSFSSAADIVAALGFQGLIEADVLDALGFFAAWQHAVKQSNDESQFSRQMDTWFDAFKILKFVHYLRDQAYPSIPLQTLLMCTERISPTLRGRAAQLLANVKNV
ncbi:hypothetical protein [Alkalimarinus coralli]|uniref:hypothetical protein n=1 Tax=Alkalimarinus coralli TaxID=2935863 RepID=UPI00202B78F2|nr:hypothetical protein [Alkalimarinus coralli]